MQAAEEANASIDDNLMCSRVLAHRQGPLQARGWASAPGSAVVLNGIASPGATQDARGSRGGLSLANVAAINDLTEDVDLLINSSVSVKQ
jgi:hypothetical protein